jgi:hypothetical protein
MKLVFNTSPPMMLDKGVKMFPDIEGSLTAETQPRR